MSVLIKYKLPRFVAMQSKTTKNSFTALRLLDKDDPEHHLGFTYWRDGGQWGVKHKKVGNKLLSVSSYNGMPWLSGCRLVAITKAAWAKDNGEYTPSLKKHKSSTKDLPF